MNTYSSYVKKDDLKYNIDSLENQKLRLNMFIAECDIKGLIPKKHRSILLTKLNELCSSGQLSLTKPIQPFYKDILDSLELIDKMNNKLNHTSLGQNDNSLEQAELEQENILSIEGNNNHVNIQVNEPDSVQENWELLPNKQSLDNSDLKLKVSDINNQN